MKSVQFLVDFFAVDGSGNRFVKYGQGQTYPYDEETASQVAAGFALLVQTEEVKQAKPPAQTKRSAVIEESAPVEPATPEADSAATAA